ncbi:MAG: S8 family serine peptidase [Candidatus Hydrothermales bacterium]
MLGLILSFIISVEVGPKLKKVLSEGKEGVYPVLIYVKNTLDEKELEKLTESKSKELKRKIVIQKLKENAAVSQKEILNFLRGKNIKDIRPIWIVNAIYVKLDLKTIRELLTRSDLEGIEIDEPVKAILKDTKPGKKIRINSIPAAPDTAWGVKYINAKHAWSLGYKGNGVVVGIFDTGVNYNHNDIKDRIFKNEVEYAGLPGVDDDGNGYVDDYIGWDFANWDNDPMDDYRDMWGNPVFHGSHVAGTVAGDGTSGMLTGVAPEATILPLKVLNSAGWAAEGWVWLAMEYGLEMGCDVMSFSIGWMNEWTLDRSRWRYASKMVRLAGAVMSCAAGNNANDSPTENIPNPGSSPPPWLHPTQIATGNVGSLSAVITVGALTLDGDTAGFSSVGPSYWGNVPPWNDFPLPTGLIDPDILAPGDLVQSLAGETNDGYRLMSGTSMATPHISGVLSLLFSKNPEMTPRMADSIIETTATDMGPAGKDNVYGAGRLNLPLAINSLPLPQFNLVILKDSIYDGNDGIIKPGETVNYYLRVKNTGTGTITGVTAHLTSPSRYLTIVNANTNVGNISGGSTALVGPFIFNVSNDVPREARAIFFVEFYGNSNNYYAKRFSVCILNPYSPTEVYGPDLYGYYAYESKDTDPYRPTFSWIPTPANATSHNLTDDSAAVVNLPFTFKYYNMPISYIVIGNNGHLIVAALSSFSPIENMPLPYRDAYPMISPLWADYDQTVNGNYGYTYSFYDAANHRFVVTYYDVRHSTYAGGPSNAYERFQVILYDPAYYPTPTGDGEIVFQYKRKPRLQEEYYVPWNVGCVIGIESPYEHTGITAWYADAPRPGFHSPDSNYAIKFTTVQPSPFSELSVNERENKNKLVLKKTIGKNEIFLSIKGEETGFVSLYGLSGRKIGILKNGKLSGDMYIRIPNELPKGIYFIKIDTDKRKVTEKIVISE